MVGYFHNAWLAHVHGEYERGISVTERISQTRILGKEHYLDLLSEASGNCYVTNNVFDRWQGGKTIKENKPPRIFKLYIDLDANPKKGTTLLDAHRDYRILISWIKDMGIPAQGSFSGRKGFNIYLFTGSKGIRLQRPVLIIGKFITQLIDKLKLTTVDRQTSADIMRITRVVFTKHAKSGYHCIPITKLEEEIHYDIESLGEILGNARLPTRQFVKDHPVMTPNSCFGHSLGSYLEELERKLLWEDQELQVEREFPTEEYEAPYDAEPSFKDDLWRFLGVDDFGINSTGMKMRVNVNTDQSNLFPCLKNVWEEAKKGTKPDHLAFLAIALFYKNRKDKTEDELSQMFSDNLGHNHWYNQEMVDNQLHSIFASDYDHTTSCEKLRTGVPDICLEKKCYIYKRFVTR